MPEITDQEFEAILAKNFIAREVKRFAKDKKDNREPTNYLASEYIIERLKEIEKVLGQANQPSVKSIFNSEMDI